MATIRLYTTALEHQATQNITWRGTKLTAETPHGITTIRTDRIDKHAGNITIAQVAEVDGETATFRVEVIAWHERGEHPAQSEYVLTPLSDDAARIVTAALTKPVPQAVNCHINKIGPNAYSLESLAAIRNSWYDAGSTSEARRQRQLNAMFRVPPYRVAPDAVRAAKKKAKEARIEALKRKVSVAQWRRAAAYQRLHGTYRSLAQFDDPRSIADRELSDAQASLAWEYGSE